MSAEIRSLCYKLLDKWFFPDFSNKITWLVLTVGTSFLLVPESAKLLFYNWLISSFNLNSGLPLELPKIEESNDYTTGLVLVVLALLHNVSYKYFSFRKETFEYEVSKELKISDYKLFENFLCVVPSSGDSLILLKDHDFGNSFYRSHLSQIESFVQNWNSAEFYFQDQNIDASRVSLWKKSNEFLNKLYQCSSPVNTSDLYSVIPSHFKNQPRPKWISEEIEVLNQMSTQLYKEHQEFITLSKSQL